MCIRDRNSDDAVVMRVGNMMLIVTLFHGHIPDNEAEINAENNYMWPEAVEEMCIRDRATPMMER